VNIESLVESSPTEAMMSVLATAAEFEDASHHMGGRDCWLAGWCGEGHRKLPG